MVFRRNRAPQQAVSSSCLQHDSKWGSSPSRSLSSPPPEPSWWWLRSVPSWLTHCCPSCHSSGGSRAPRALWHPTLGPVWLLGAAAGGPPHPALGLAPACCWNLPPSACAPVAALQPSLELRSAGVSQFGQQWPLSVVVHTSSCPRVPCSPS